MNTCNTFAICLVCGKKVGAIPTIKGYLFRSLDDGCTARNCPHCGGTLSSNDVRVLQDPVFEDLTGFFKVGDNVCHFVHGDGKVTKVADSRVYVHFAKGIPDSIYTLSGSDFITKGSRQLFHGTHSDVFTINEKPPVDILWYVHAGPLTKDSPAFTNKPDAIRHRLRLRSAGIKITPVEVPRGSTLWGK